ncbi:hypothetical protein D3C72_1938330 [compost metagenome]
MGDGWVLWWSGRQIAHVTPAKDGWVRVHLDARKMWETKNEWAASIQQGKRYAEWWCAAWILVGVPLRQAVQQLTAKPEERAQPKRSPAQLQQERRLREALKLRGLSPSIGAATSASIIRRTT